MHPKAACPPGLLEDGRSHLSRAGAHKGVRRDAVAPTGCGNRSIAPGAAHHGVEVCLDIKDTSAAIVQRSKAVDRPSQAKRFTCGGILDTFPIWAVICQEAAVRFQTPVDVQCIFRLLSKVQSCTGGMDPGAPIGSDLCQPGPVGFLVITQETANSGDTGDLLPSMV